MLKVPRDKDGNINPGVAFIPNTFAPSHVQSKKFSIASIIRFGQIGMWNKTKLPKEVSEIVGEYGKQVRFKEQQSKAGTNNRSFGSAGAADRDSPFEK